jgi:DNA-binding transcriptional LysR family regulator
MDKLTSMKVFAAVARLGSFSAASEELGISRAMASKYLSFLEDDLNVRLLNRTTRQISLTEVGSHYLERINNILDEIEDTELAVTQLQTEPRGTLKIMTPPSFGSFHLARALGIYKERYPEVVIEMILTDRAPDLFEEGLDLAIWIGELEDSSLIARKLATTRSVVCGSPEYLKRKGIPRSPADLQQHNCLTFSTRTPFSDWKLMVDGKLTVLHPIGTFRANSADPLRIAAINDCGLVQLPSYIVGLDIQAGRLQPVLEDFEQEPLVINAVYIHRRHLSTKARTFVDFMCGLFQPSPYWEKWIPED